MAHRALYHSLSVLILFLCLSACQQNKNTSDLPKAYFEKIAEERIHKNKQLLIDSVIEDQDRNNFKGLNYYDANSGFVVKAIMRKLPPLKLVFKTNTDYSPEYYTFCTLEFKIGDSTCHLIAYSKDADAKEGLFIPFKDAGSGIDTYGGGRYLELPYNGETDEFELDFNRAFNPYCHYNHRYSCPLVPIENILNVDIQAGEKKFHD